jgi:hypothetical protein
MEQNNQNLALQRQESRLPASGDEQVLAESLKELKISQLPTTEPIAEALRYAMVLIGLRADNWPAPAEKAVLISYIIRHYGGHTVAEIRLAFEMAIGGRFGVDTNCYENFSVAYFASIMSVYRRWAAETASLIKTPIKALQGPGVSDEEFVQANYTIYKITKDFKRIHPLAYKVLKDRLGLTEEDRARIKAIVDNVTPDDGKREDLYKTYAVKEYFDNLNA